ncbi:hypothetical protein B0T24DRAFT_677039 [Lasiosphaeria ovina]|uniref:Uncharacterized protein n=1 Tax=Lasiosphaeria ovina TaxID=92902 RepID=A0AAE0KGK9_9PEZI|nr:hypothetical protein B0T24DRAFT_677039 [Lasiosphaeria ovina]
MARQLTNVDRGYYLEGGPSREPSQIRESQKESEESPDDLTPPRQVDDEDYGVDEALGDMDWPSSEPSSTTTSDDQLIQEHGRTYQSYKPESVWAVEFATAPPEVHVTGIRPHAPPNCSFHVAGSEDAWHFTTSPFDYVHARFITMAFSDIPRVFASAFAAMAPGGAIEFQDYFIPLQCADGSLARTAVARWNELVVAGAARVGKSRVAAARYLRQMLDAGFVDVAERCFALPGNLWPRGAGAMQLANQLGGLHGMSMRIFIQALGMAVDEVERFLADVARELQDRNIYFYYIFNAG